MKGMVTIAGIAFMAVLVFASSVAASPTAEILTPASGSKVYKGGNLDVRIRAVPAGAEIARWQVVALADDEPVQVASGTMATDGAVVGQVIPGNLEPGKTYRLLLEVFDAASESARAEVTFHFANPKYLTIPFEAGDHEQDFYEGHSIDSAGDLIAVRALPDRSPNVNSEFVDLIHRWTGEWEHVPLGLSADTFGQQLSADGTRFFFRGSFSEGVDVGYLDVASGHLTPVAKSNRPYFSVDAAGERIAFQKIVGRSSQGEPIYQYFLKDITANHEVQITDQPDAIGFDDGLFACPRLEVTVPLIDAAGEHVFFVTPSTLGLVPADPQYPCRLFRYDVATGNTQLLLAFDSHTTITSTHIDDAAEWFSFNALRPTPRFQVPSLFNLMTFQLVESLPGAGDHVSFDSVVTRDGKHVIISSQGDLDPETGNADGNLELFRYDIDSGTYEQVSETLAGVGRTPNLCDAYEPVADGSGEVVLFTNLVFSGGGCFLDGQQRNERDGFYFRRVRAVRRRPGNSPPQMQPLSTLKVLAGSTIDLTLRAEDADADPITFFVQLADEDAIPYGSTVVDHHDGTATFLWHTRPEQAGRYHVRAAAFDEGGDEVVQALAVYLCNNLPPPSDIDAVVATLFDATPNPCFDSDRNQDGRVTAGDLIS